MRILVLVLVLVGCGRISFDPARDGGSADGVVDVPVTTCTSGAHIAPMAALNTSLSISTDACSVDSILAMDGLTAGADRDPVAPCPLDWDPNGSCGCVTADLGASYRVSSVTMWVAPVGQACGTACVGVDCGTGHVFSAFIGNDLGVVPQLVESTTASSTALSPFSYTVQQPVRYITLCRQAYGATRDDFAIDYMEATCE